MTIADLPPNAHKHIVAMLNTRSTARYASTSRTSRAVSADQLRNIHAAIQKIRAVRRKFVDTELQKIVTRSLEICRSLFATGRKPLGADVVTENVGLFKHTWKTFSDMPNANVYTPPLYFGMDFRASRGYDRAFAWIGFSKSRPRTDFGLLVMVSDIKRDDQEIVAAEFWVRVDSKSIKLLTAPRIVYAHDEQDMGRYVRIIRNAVSRFSRNISR